jgi:hypothetical protein
VRALRDDLAMELTSPLGNVTYPANLTLANFVDFLFCPTLCYELEYPRTDCIVWSELFYKTLAVFGCIFLLTVTSEEFVLPVLAESSAAMHASASLGDRAMVLAETTSKLLFPFMVSFLLVFLVIFEYILGAFAEITCSSPLWPVIRLTRRRLRGPPLLLGLVELVRLARVLARVEHARAPLLPPARLHGVARPRVAARRDGHHISHLSVRSRAGHGLHHQEAARLRLCGHDAADAHRHGAAEPVGEGTDPAQCTFAVVAFALTL